MSIRGIGDRHARQRLAWLFVGTVVVPSALLGLMALGALGQARWSAWETAVRDVAVQLPHLERRLSDGLEAGVVTLAPATPADACGPYAASGVAAWLAAELLPRDGGAAHVEVGVAPTLFPLRGALTGCYAAIVPPPAPTSPAHPSAVAAFGLFALVLTGTFFALGAADRELRMSERQIDQIQRVSHEIRTPLTSIRLFVDTLRARHLPPERTEECLDLLAKETDRLSRRIEEVIHWARMEAGARTYRTSAVAPVDVAREAVDAFRSQNLQDDPAQPDLRVEVSGELPEIDADRDALVEAVLNLLVNARRHAGAGAQIVLAARAEGRRVGLSVSDDGPGISSRDRQRIFEKFYQNHDPADVSNRGSGLGLAIVRSIVKAHGGRIELDSAPGRGSTFTLWLPQA